MPTDLSTYLDVPPSAVSDSMDECQLWNDFRQGSKSAFAAIYTRYFPVLAAYGRRICKDEDLVHDCIQDLFTELLRSNVSATTSVRYYLYRCIRRKIAVKMNASKRGGLESLDDFVNAALPEAIILPIEFQQIEFERAAERKEEILRALQLLTRKQRKVMQLRFYEEMSYKQIASVMSVHIDTVYNIASKATSALRGLINRSALFILLFNIFKVPLE